MPAPALEQHDMPPAGAIRIKTDARKTVAQDPDPANWHAIFVEGEGLVVLIPGEDEQLRVDR